MLAEMTPHERDDLVISQARNRLPPELFHLIGTFVKPYILSVCPICKRKIDPRISTECRSYKDYFFCSKRCLQLALSPTTCVFILIHA